MLAGHKEWVSEAKNRGEPEKCDGQKKDFAESEGMDADQDHVYGIYKHRTCQISPSTPTDRRVNPSRFRGPASSSAMAPPEIW